MNFARQVFISYAHLDNQPLGADQTGWVSLFHTTLQTLLSQRLGSVADIWRDDKLHGNDDFSDEILDQLAGTAVFVSILTPRYLKSDWCKREIRSFCQQAEAGHSLTVGNKARVIKVLKLPVDEGSELPPVVGRLLGYDFYEVDEEHVPHELDPAYGDRPRQAFLRKANKLAWDLAAQLTDLERPHPDAGKADDAPGTRPAVFLAECSRDRREARDSIASELACCGFRVLPETRLPDDEDEYLTAVGALLETCVLSVHLVGSGYGRVPDGDRQQSVVVLQNELAAARSRSHGLRRVIWLPAGITSAQPAQQAFLDALQTDAALQFGADLVSGDLETAKSAIHTALKPPAPLPSQSLDGAARVHLVCDANDRKSVVPLIKQLRSRGLEVSLPAFVGDAAQVRETNRQLALDCDAILLYYGAGDEAWKFHQQNDLRKLLGSPRGRPLKASLTLLAAPPSDDKDVLQALAEPDVLDALDGIRDATLAPLYAALGLSETP